MVGWLAGATAIATDTSGCHRVLFMICNFLANYYSLRSSAIHDDNTQNRNYTILLSFFPKHFYLKCVRKENGEILKIMLMLVLAWMLISFRLSVQTDPNQLSEEMVYIYGHLENFCTHTHMCTSYSFNVILTVLLIQNTNSIDGYIKSDRFGSKFCHEHC